LTRAAHRARRIFGLRKKQALWPYFEQRPNTFRHNIVYLTQGQLLIPYGERSLNERLAAKESLGDWDDNLYWDTAGPEALRFFRRSFSEWQAIGLDQHSRIADPRFVDAAGHDFRLKRSSPAFDLGFREFDISRAGLCGDATWVKEASHTRYPRTALPPPPAPPEPLEVEDGFEATPVGMAPSGAHVSGEEKGASIRVSAERAVTGQHSLKVTDSATLQPSWQPHFYYEPHITLGRGTPCSISTTCASSASRNELGGGAGWKRICKPACKHGLTHISAMGPAASVAHSELDSPSDPNSPS
jgi:hypothetical protein